MSSHVRPRLAAVTIGQSGRPDLRAILMAHLPLHIDILEVGVLDQVAIGEIPVDVGGDYPLTTLLRDGSSVTVGETYLNPLVQRAIQAVERVGIDGSILLCAARFADVEGGTTLIRPFDAAVTELHALAAHRVLVVVPASDQESPSARKWRSAGFDAHVVVDRPPFKLAVAQAHEAAYQAVVLDYFGHAPPTVVRLRGVLQTPVVDLGEAGARAAAATFTGAST